MFSEHSISTWQVVDPVTPSDTPPAGDATPEPAAAPEPEYLTRADLDAWADRFASKINGEMARHRKRANGTNGATPEPKHEGTNGTNGATPAVTMSDVEAAMEIGRLEVALPAGVREELAPDLEGLGFAERAKLLRLAAKIAGGATPKNSTGPRRTQETQRATTSASRDSAPHPRTMAEYLEIATSKPELKRKLDRDPTFDPYALER